MDREQKIRELQALRAKAEELENELIYDSPPRVWVPTGYYTAYYATAGFVLGIFGASASLLFNVVGSLIVGQHPLRLIQIYLTFPLGERMLAENLENTGLVLVIGCCLYLATGMALGVPFHLALTRLTGNSGIGTRFVVATILSLALWIINFYGILYWLQPALFGGRWIFDDIPWYIAALTHLIYGWTMVLVYPLGLYVPYQSSTERT